ncbi:MAG: penicillin-binding protein 2, partial [Pseudomonadales bacterium]
MPEPIALKDHSRESRLFVARIIWASGFLAALTLVLVARYFYLQVMQHESYSTLSDNNRIQVQPVPPIRGLIYDRNGELLADNAPSFNLTVTPERIDDLETTLAKLKAVVQLKDTELAAFRKRLARRQRPFESVPIRYQLSEEEIAKISVDLYKLPGVEVEDRLVRHYPQAELTVHAIGSVRRINEEDARRLDRVAYAGTDHVGKIGVEKFYEKDLLGQVGYRHVETDANGRIMNTLIETAPKQGNNLILYLDSSLQRAASQALGERRGAVVAIEPQTGGILALVSKPGYDPNLFVTGIDHAAYSLLRESRDTPLFNRAVQGQYEPGSTIKPILALAGLATDSITKDYSIADPGWFRLPNNTRLYRDWNWQASGAGGHGEVNLLKAIYQSCNVYFYALAVKLGIDQLGDYLSKFGFGQVSVLDLPEAQKGLIPSQEWKQAARGEPWYPGDTVNLGIGQGDMLVTPLQLATAGAVIANRGRRIAPRMLKEGSNLLNASPTELPGDINEVPPGAWDQVIVAMQNVVHRGNQGLGENGTAWFHIGRDIPYRMAGKSGTAQVVSIKQGEVYDEEELDERLRKHAWFLGFAPVEDPQIVVAVLVENGGGGSEFAAPVARAI